jgi:endoglucanase
VNGNTAAEYVAAWRHVVDIFRAENALNVKWIWCIATSGDQDPTVIQSLFPGDNYVDWVAMDGYNRNRNGNWRSFSTIFSTDYQLLTTMSTRPVMIAETASVEDSSDPTRKAAWIQDAFLNAIPNYFPRIQAALYFDSSDTACPSLPWSSSSAALTAVQSVLSSSAYTP